MLDIERIVKVQSEVAELYKSAELLSIDYNRVHLQPKGLVQVEPDKSQWVIVHRYDSDTESAYPLMASVLLHGTKWFAIGTQEDFDEC